MRTAQKCPAEVLKRSALSKLLQVVLINKFGEKLLCNAIHSCEVVSGSRSKPPDPSPRTPSTFLTCFSRAAFEGYSLAHALFGGACADVFGDLHHGRMPGWVAVDHPESAAGCAGGAGGAAIFSLSRAADWHNLARA